MAQSLGIYNSIVGTQTNRGLLTILVLVPYVSAKGLLLPFRFSKAATTSQMLILQISALFDLSHHVNVLTEQAFLVTSFAQAICTGYIL